MHTIYNQILNLLITHNLKYTPCSHVNIVVVIVVIVVVIIVVVIVVVQIVVVSDGYHRDKDRRQERQQAETYHKLKMYHSYQNILMFT